MPQQLNKKDLILVAGGTFLLLAIVVVFFTQYWHKSGTLPFGYQAVIASSDIPLSPAATFTNSSNALTPIKVDGQGTATVYDTASDAGHGYYLMGSESQHRINLYREDLKNTKAGLEELTHSDTLKFDLSYDALSGVAAYVSVAKDGSKHVMVWSPITKKESDLGVGLHPTLLPGGFFVVLERAGKILSVRVETKGSYDLLPLPPGSSYAVDAGHMKIALYDPIAHLVKEFSVANSIGASYVGGTPAATKPMGMFYSNGTLLKVGKDTKSGDIVLPSGALPEHYKLSIHHD